MRPARDHLDADALTPELQLVDRRGAEGVRRGEDALAVPLKAAASLAMLVVLPTPLTPTTRITAGAGVLPFAALPQSRPFSSPTLRIAASSS
jgi:hypothetical protein